MAHLLRVAEVATGATEAVLHTWGIAESARYNAGDVIATLETDKAVVDIEAEDDGRLVRQLVEEGSRVNVGEAIALLAATDEHLDDIDAALARLQGQDDAAGAGAVAAGSASGVSAPVVPSEREVEVVGPAHPGRVFSSPLARRMARDAGLTVEQITGTGPGGRIVKRDVQKAMNGRVPGVAVPPPAAPPVVGSFAVATPPVIATSSAETPSFVDIPHSGVRRATAARLTASKQSAPHFYLRAGVDVGEILSLRSRLQAAGIKVSVNDFVIRAVSLAHTRVPEMNVIWMPDAVRSFSSVDVAMAVSTDRGLLTPVLRGVESMSISAVAQSSRDLAARARSGGLRQHELDGGTVAVTNLGMFGVEEFTAIINPPQSAILAVGAARPQGVVRDGALVIRTIMRVVLAVDHRPVDGTVAARWLQALVELLEQPVLLMA